MKFGNQFLIPGYWYSTIPQQAIQTAAQKKTRISGRQFSSVLTTTLSTINTGSIRKTFLNSVSIAAHATSPYAIGNHAQIHASAKGQIQTGIHGDSPESLLLNRCIANHRHKPYKTSSMGWIRNCGVIFTVR